MSEFSEPVGSTTPELDKQLEIIKSGRAETVQEFLDWLLGRYMLARRDADSAHRDLSGGVGCYWPSRVNPQDLMAKHFDIDLTKVEDERRAILEALRSHSDV